MNESDEKELRRLLSKVGKDEARYVIDSMDDVKNYEAENNHNDYILDEETIVSSKPIQDYHTSQIRERFTNRKKMNQRDIDTYDYLTYIHNYGVKKLWEDIRTIIESKKEIDISDLTGELNEKDLY